MCTDLYKITLGVHTVQNHVQDMVKKVEQGQC